MVSANRVAAINPLSTMQTRYGNSISTPEAIRTCKTQQKSLQKGSRHGISVSTPHRRHGHRLRTPFLRTPFPRLLLLPFSQHWGVFDLRRRFQESADKFSELLPLCALLLYPYATVLPIKTSQPFPAGGKEQHVQPTSGIAELAQGQPLSASFQRCYTRVHADASLGLRDDLRAGKDFLEEI